MNAEGTASFFTALRSGRVWKKVIFNFFLWLVPCVPLCLVYMACMGLSVQAGGASFPPIENKLPSGTLSCLAILLLATATWIIVQLVGGRFAEMEIGIPLVLVSFISLVAGGVFLVRELKRLATRV